jgi:predicted nucleic acid-binding protein
LFNGLERIGQLELLPRVFSTVYAPPMVATEVKTSLSWLRVKPVNNMAVVATLKTQMDAGEAEAIALVPLRGSQKAKGTHAKVGLVRL